MTITTLTPHPIRIYGWKVPDRFDLGDYEPEYVLEPSGTVARIGQIELGTQSMRGVDTPVEYVEFRHFSGLPPKYENFDTNTDWYVVSLALALQLVEMDRDRGGRNDMLVPYQEIRSNEGTVIGCRSLALPV